jgi:hypothetical protein
MSTNGQKHEIFTLDFIDNENVKIVPNTNNRHAADKLGNVYVIKRGRVMKKICKPNCHGYVLLGGIWYNGKFCSKYAHTLVAEAFLGVQEGKVIDHLNGDKADNRLENLEYVTTQENCKRYSEYCKENNIKRVRGKAAKTYQIIEYDNDWNEVRRFNSIKEAGKTIATEEGQPDKWNSISTQISYVLSGKYGCKTVHGRNFKLADDKIVAYMKKKVSKQLTPDEVDIIEKMRKAAKNLKKQREQENIKEQEKVISKGKETMVVHKYDVKNKIRVDFEVETDYTGRVDLSEL